MTKKFKVVVVDDHPVVRRGICATFAEETDFEIAGQGGSADEAVKLARENRPDVVLLDVNMPGGGIEAAASIVAARPETAILMLSIREDLATVRAALRAGAHGYISKGVSGDDLVASTRRVLAGERYVSPELGARLIAEDLPARENAPVDRVTLRSALTQRERQVFDLLGEGLSNQQIAERVGLTENTIKHYMTPLLHKLGVRNRTEAALLARKSGPGSNSH
jgi:two-component system, NarL family, nitrate/nitrite response regulator NarL